jgi:hypothetical protein
MRIDGNELHPAPVFIEGGDEGEVFGGLLGELLVVATTVSTKSYLHDE